MTIDYKTLFVIQRRFPIKAYKDLRTYILNMKIMLKNPEIARKVQADIEELDRIENEQRRFLA